jgi:fructosamine-3-kinase
MKYTTDVGEFFVKMNRIEDKKLLLSEAMSLTSIERTRTIRVPKPLHVGELPQVGDVGPGSFLVAEYLRRDSTQTPNPKPQTLNPKPYALNPKAQTPFLYPGWSPSEL